MKPRLKLPLTHLNKLEKSCGRKSSYSIQEHATLHSESEFSSNIHNISNKWISYPVAESFENYHEIVQH